MTPWSALSDGEATVLEHAFWAPGLSRETLARATGLSRTRVNTLASGLLEQGLLQESGLQTSSGGRRPGSLRLHRGLGVVLCAALGATGLDVAVLTPDLQLLARHGEAADVRNGPALVLSRVRALMRELLRDLKLAPAQVLAIGIGVPGPVDFDSGQLVNPPLMPDWDSFSIRDDLRQDYAAPVFVDNDVNLMALAELWRLQRRLQNFLVIKVGTGIGCGIVCHGAVYRGVNGSAGDVGHICVDPKGPRCHCGNLGCVEAMAAGPAIEGLALDAAKRGDSPMLAQALAERGTISAQDVAQASRSGDAAANAIVQRAGSLIGQMLASVVNFFNPSHVFIGGRITAIGPLLLASVRQSVYQRSLALSTRHLEIQYTPLGVQAGPLGAAVLALHETLARRGQVARGTA